MIGETIIIMMMESIYAIGLVALGFVPTLAALELTWKMTTRRLAKRDAASRVSSATDYPA